jgi:pectate lyase
MVILGLFMLLPEFALGIPAFPGAEGMGASSVGGRGGKVYIITNLNNSGSFREACEASGPRIIVFRVSGHIHLTADLTINNPYLTIAGQTSPGGICLSGGMFEIRTHDIIVTHMRFRRGSDVCDQNNNCDTHGDTVRVMGIPGSDAYNVIFDHCSMSWGCDETIDNGGYNGNTYDVTYSWCCIAEGLDDPAPETNHGFGINIGSHYQSSGQIAVTLHHNFIADFRDRLPYVVYNGFVDMRNNVVYNWGNALSMQIQHVEGYESTKGNFVHNYVKPGPLSNPYNADIPAGECFFIGTGQKGHVGAEETRYKAFYVFGNIGYSRTTQDDPQWCVLEGWGPPNVLNETEWGQSTPFPTNGIPVTTTTMTTSYVDTILAGVGATKPVRDSVDTRLIDEYYAGTGGTKPDMHWSDYPTGWPVFSNPSPPSDTDNDGMADSWEAARGLNTALDDSALDDDGDGYTNIEEYIHYIGAYTVEGNVPRTPKNLRIATQ